jgi:hypothetical protein
MASLRMLVPDGSINYVKNPSIRYDTTGYTLHGAAITRSFDRARFGFASLRVITAGLGYFEGVHYTISWMAAIFDVVTASAYVRGSGMVRIRIGSNEGTYVSKSVRINDERWTRLSVTGQSGGGDVEISVETTDKAVSTFYVDGLQLERKPYATTYCDGDQPGCIWNIMQHGSISTRSPYTRAGGRFIELADCDRDEKNLYMTVIGGLGVAPIQNNTQSYADAPGSYYQDSKTLDRVITITFHATSPDLRGNKAKSLKDLHALRKLLFDIIRPDKTAGGEEFVLEYQDGDFPVYVRVRYEGGLEGSWDIRNRFVQSFPIRFLAVSPYLYDDNYEAASLNFGEGATINYVMGRFDGRWGMMGTGMDAFINDFEIGKRGEVIAVGTFHTAGGVLASHVAYWDGTNWNAFGGASNGTINAVAIAPNGDIYVTGSFGTINGVACTNIAKWNGTAWSALGSGLGSTGFAVKVAPNGDVYAGGSFVTAGGIVAKYCARWDGLMWNPMGTYQGMNNTVYSLAISNDGTQIFLGGAFTDEFTATITPPLRVSVYEVAYGQFFPLGDGFDNTVLKVVLSPSGQLYACGDFTMSGAQTMLYVSYWNGAAWYNLGAGGNDTVRSMDVDKFGNILAAGDFTRMGSANAQGVALYNGSTWVGLDVETHSACYAVKWDSAGNIFLAPNSTVADFAAITTIEAKGTAETNPVVYIVGPCTLRWLENLTTKKRVYADLEILNGEEVVFEFGTGKVESTVRGDLSYAISPGSDMRAWTLLPGSNRITALMIDDVLATMRIYHAPRYWSVDGMVDEEGF